MTPKNTHCAGNYTAQHPFLHPQCQTCQRRPALMPDHAHWIAPPDFDDHCPERITAESQKQTPQPATNAGFFNA